jgi:hypothetical protein
MTNTIDYCGLKWFACGNELGYVTLDDWNAGRTKLWNEHTFSFPEDVRRLSISSSGILDVLRVHTDAGVFLILGSEPVGFYSICI